MMRWSVARGLAVWIILSAIGVVLLSLPDADQRLFSLSRDHGVSALDAVGIQDERWTVPNPVGLDGVFEALCPPYYPDMQAAVGAFVDHKFGPGGAYDPKIEGPWKDSAEIKKGVEPYSDEFVECLGEVAQYVYDKHGKFPGTPTTIVLPGFVQAHHVDTDYYDAHYLPGAYLDTHANHMRRWHGHGIH